MKKIDFNKCQIIATLTQEEKDAWFKTQVENARDKMLGRHQLKHDHRGLLSTYFLMFLVVGIFTTYTYIFFGTHTHTPESIYGQR